MRMPLALLLAGLLAAETALAQERQTCEIPRSFLFGSNDLKHVTEAVTKQHKLTIAVVRSRMSAEDMAHGMGKLLADEKPDLVIWQTGTLDAIRRIDPDDFRTALEQGVETLQKGGADVILMNMQYSPRTDIMVALGPYADNMRVVAQQHEIPLFDRLAIMRQWSDSGAFDLYAAGKDNVLAHRVHDCIGRGIAVMITDAAHLRDLRPGQ